MRVERADDGANRHLLGKGCQRIERVVVIAHMEALQLQLLDLGLHETSRSGDDKCTGLF